MNPIRRSSLLVIFLINTLFIGSVCAHTPAEEMGEAAQNLLAALSPEQRAKIVYQMTNDERMNWDFVPHDRNGLTFKEMTSAQRLLAHALLSSGLSQRGYAKAVTIMSLDQILKDLEKGNGPRRDPEMYYVTLFGNPTNKEPWGWRVEGHHLSVNFTIVNENEISTSPTFFGSNPGIVVEGPRQGLSVLATEQELGRQLVTMLNDEQRTIAIFTNVAPREIVTGKQHKVSPLAPDGIAFAKMTTEQKAVFRQLIEEYAYRLRHELAENDLKHIESGGWDKVHFAWAGGIKPGEANYYRVQGPTFLLEFDNTQNNANHIHTVWRDFQKDFGEDLLRRHYEQVPHAK
jgi:hypothetical protein